MAHIYTNGSAQDNGSAGASFYGEKLFESSFAAGLGATNFDADINAVRQVICHLTNLATYYRQVVFIVDSQSTILTFCSLHNSKLNRGGGEAKNL
ncbi:hypothetical protein TNIN_292101 [Trichonephila inaurata madagascariensis]|uniref:Uncharacterized protein n=1 Tax=Trichonephila inaurata madagascariensis TaxID=2747483 RepID=A0A8X6XBK3_9ARAC|nr:hypothetical protein TNIN_292101 [Trichonephila inaurata madagascariensis]